ncbi:MAG: hypothetical protein AAF702_38770 [Chloroflexota bacterium]
MLAQIYTLSALLLGCTTACNIFLPLAVSDDPPVLPVPASSLITQITWDEVDSIVRAASGSDNWPLTWASDGDLYTTYGDGNGFEPQIDTKLSLGFAKVTGGPEDFVGINIRSEDEQFGGGASGKKASGMLMVDEILYMWVRNADNNGRGCQLAWSSDSAVSWTWSEWTFTDFGYCTFINFGSNYEGALDEYVYMVTPDSPSAYDPADDFVLTRVHKEKITVRDEYEFFVALDGDIPQWSDDITSRGSVFSNPGGVRRSGISYNAGLERFLWWQGLPDPNQDQRYEGGFGVYDAPTPWGPWTTAYFTAEWDVGPGETGSFPTKWMSDDGQTIYLVFSGDDYFAVRKATLTVAE